MSACFRRRLITLLMQRQLLNERLAKNMVQGPTPYSDCFRADLEIFPPTAFLAELFKHLPDARYRLIRCCGRCSPQARGTWSHAPHLLRLAPEGWKHSHPALPTVPLGPPDEHQGDCSVAARQSRSARARLIKKVRGGSPDLYGA
jgi:hypothetical protein